MDESILDATNMEDDLRELVNVGTTMAKDEGKEAEVFKQKVDEMKAKVDELEQRVNDVAQFYSSINKKQLNSSKGSSVMKDREKDKVPANNNKKQQEAPCKEVAPACTKRMQELMRQFATILRQITQHKWAWPFMQPVDVEGLGLHDYYEVIKKPMDLGTIRNQMEAKDGTGYKNVREICADVRLVFKNAMTYNDEKSDAHVMAKTLLAKFEEKWLLLFPKVIEEETKRLEEEARADSDMQIAQEVATAKLARDISNELDELDLHLDELRETLVQKCRKMSVEEKRHLGSSLSRLSPEDLDKALEIIAQKNPGFQPKAEEVDIDMDTLSESTLWRLKFFVKEALYVQARSSASKAQDASKRKRVICDALAKTAKKRSRRNVYAVAGSHALIKIE